MDILLKPKNQIMTSEIQNAIDTCFLSGGGKIVFEKGDYLLGSIRLRSNCTLYLKSGATLKGSRNINDYFLDNDLIEPINPSYKTNVLWQPCGVRENDDHFNKPLSRWNNSLIRIIDAQNVSIIGEENSVIDGQDPYDELGESYFRGPHGIAFHNSKNLSFSGYTIKNTGNWAHIGYKSQNITFTGIEVHGGHDGIHNSSCDDFTIENCSFYTGDDCVAGFDNVNVTIKNCKFNSACSGLRFGGTNVLVENCKFFGPCMYAFRGSLSLADKISGTPTPKDGRKNMLSLFTYYSDFSLTVRNTPGNIIIKNCVVENCDRFLHYDFTGTHTWQKNKPLSSITFQNIVATGVTMPFNAYGDKETPLNLVLRNLDVTFNKEVNSVIRGGNFELISVENSTFTGVNGPLVNCYGKLGEIKTYNVSGIDNVYITTNEEFVSDNI